MLPMIHTRPDTGISVSSGSAPGDGEQDDGGQRKQDEFHRLMVLVQRQFTMLDRVQSIELSCILNVAAMRCSTQ